MQNEIKGYLFVQNEIKGDLFVQLRLYFSENVCLYYEKQTFWRDLAFLTWHTL